MLSCLLPVVLAILMGGPNETDKRGFDLFRYDVESGTYTRLRFVETRSLKSNRSPTTASTENTIGTWWRNAGPLSGKLTIKKNGRHLTETWTFMSGGTLTRKLVESEESGLRRFDVPSTEHFKEHYIVQRDGWLRLGDADGVFEVISPVD